MAGSARNLGLVALLGVLSYSPAGAVPSDQPESNVPATDWDTEIQRALDADFSVDAVELPLGDFARFVHQSTGILVLVDQRSLDDVGIDIDTPVTCQLKNIRLSSVLKHALRPLDLTYDLRQGALLITTPEEVECRLVTRVYDVADLVGDEAVVTAQWPHEDRDHRGSDLIDALTGTLAPTSWVEVGGPGDADVFRGRLTVSQTRDVHAQVAELLGLLRKAKRMADERPYAPPTRVCLDASDEDVSTRRIRRALRQSISVAFVETPLEDAAWYFADKAKINVLLDTRALDDVGIPVDLPVTFHAPEIRVEFALWHVLRELELTYVIRDQVLLITTPEESEANLVTRLYPVADLLGRPTGSDVFGRRIRPSQAEDLMGTVTALVEMTTWEMVGGPGSIVPAPGMDVLIVSQTADVHNQIADLLDRLRAVAKESRTAEAGPSATGRQADTMRLVIYDVPTARAVPAAVSGGNAAGEGQDAPASTANQVGCGGVFDNGWEAARVIPEDQLLRVVTVLIEPDSWSQQDVMAMPLPGRLMIRHTDDVHRQIERLLSRLTGWQPPPYHGGPHWMNHNHGFGGGMGGGMMGGAGGGMF